MVATIGVDNLIIVETANATFIATQLIAVVIKICTRRGNTISTYMQGPKVIG